MSQNTQAQHQDSFGPKRNTTMISITGHTVHLCESHFLANLTDLKTRNRSVSSCFLFVCFYPDGPHYHGTFLETLSGQRNTLHVHPYVMVIEKRPDFNKNVLKDGLNLTCTKWTHVPVYNILFMSVKEFRGFNVVALNQCNQQSLGAVLPAHGPRQFSVLTRPSQHPKRVTLALASF